MHDEALDVAEGDEMMLMGARHLPKQLLKKLSTYKRNVLTAPPAPLPYESEILIVDLM